MIGIMRLLFYNFIILLSTPVAITRIFFKSLKDKDYRLNLQHRFGIYDFKIGNKKPIWFHAVSLGEVISSERIILKLIEHHEVILTVSTPTGLRHAKKLYDKKLNILYAPWDFSLFVLNAFQTFKPSALVIFETEIWPSIINKAYKQKIPVILCNGRMSEKSFRNYSKFQSLMSDTLKKFSTIFVQSESQAKRFIELGASQEKLTIAPSVKFDSISSPENKIVSDSALNNSKTLIFASTHKGEDERLINIFQKLLSKFEDLRLIIVPRHPERAEDIGGMLLKKNITYSIKKSDGIEFNSEKVIVIGAIGLLNSLYKKADLAFIGGSMLGTTGGHNIIEPAAAGCPFVVGPYMYNFEDVLDVFLSNKACIQAQNDHEIELSLKRILTDHEWHGKINALSVISKNKGSSEQQANSILNYLKN